MVLKRGAVGAALLTLVGDCRVRLINATFLCHISRLARKASVKDIIPSVQSGQRVLHL